MRFSEWLLLGTRNLSSASSKISAVPSHHEVIRCSSARLDLSNEPSRQLSGSESLQIDPSSEVDFLETPIPPEKVLLEIERSCRKGHIQTALDQLSVLVGNGFTPPEDVYWAALKSCSSQKALAPARELHGFLKKHGKGVSFSLLDYLVSTLAKCGALEEAFDVFDQLGPHRTILSWTAIIAACIEGGKVEEAFEAHRVMQLEGIEPNEYTFVALMKACGITSDLLKGIELHFHVVMRGWDANDFVGSALLSMYGKCGRLMEAETVFDSLSKTNIVSWNVLLSAYAEEGDEEKMWQLCDRLLVQGPELSERTFVLLFQACCILAEKEEAVIVDGVSIKAKSLAAGKRLQSQLHSKVFTKNSHISNILITLLGKCGSAAEAEDVFLKMSDRTVVSWSAMLSAYNHEYHVEKALQVFAKAQGDYACLNEQTFTIALHSCALLAERDEFYLVRGWETKGLPLDIGRMLHADARKRGYGENPCIGYMLVKLYGKCGSIHEARNVFNCLPRHDVGLWNALLSAYVEQKAGAVVLHLYKEMQKEGISPDEQTTVTALQGCSLLAGQEDSTCMEGKSRENCSLVVGRAIHADAEKLGFDLLFHLGSTLVSMYGKCGCVADAEKMFGRLPEQDNVAWTALISAHAEHGYVQEAFKLYHKMQDKSVILDDGTLITLVHACRDTLSLDFCRRLHFDILASMGDASLLLTTALIHAYGSCACMVDAWAVFDVLLDSDVVSWSALIDSYTIDGRFALGFGTFECMKAAGIEPNAVTFLSLISSCSHGGLVEKGVELFESMSKEHGILPNIDHFVTVVDLLGRVGELERAEDMLSRFSGQPDLAMWLCLLYACQKYGNVVLGKRIFRRAVSLYPDKASAYILMSNIFSESNGSYDTMEPDFYCYEEDTRKTYGKSPLEEIDQVQLAV